MSGFFKNKWVLRIVALLSAVVLWVIMNSAETVIYNVEITSKNKAHLKNTLNLKVDGSYPKTMQITILGRKSVLQNVNSDSFKYYIDFKDVENVDTSFLPVHDGRKGPLNGVYIKDIEFKEVDIGFKELPAPEADKETKTISLGINSIKIENKNKDYVYDIATETKKVDVVLVTDKENKSVLDNFTASNLEAVLSTENISLPVENLKLKVAVSINNYTFPNISVMEAITDNGKVYIEVPFTIQRKTSASQTPSTLSLR